MSFKQPADPTLDAQIAKGEKQPHSAPEQARATRAHRRELRKCALRRNNCGRHLQTRGKFRSDTAQEPLTTRVCGVLAKCGDSSVDLNDVAKQVGADKRRVYDVKLVLEAMDQVVMASRGRIRQRIDGCKDSEEERWAKRIRIKEELEEVDVETERGIEELKRGEGKDCCITEKLVSSVARGKLKGNVVIVSLQTYSQLESPKQEGCSREEVYLSVDLDEKE